MTKIFSFALCLLLFCADASYAADSVVSPGYIDTLQKKAEFGDTISQFNLGVLYHNGQGVPQDNKKAAEWLRKAADKGDADAELNLFVLYANGQGVPQSNEDAAKWCQLAAEAGNVNAQLILSTLYKKGQGVPKNDRLATGWFVRAAQNSGNAHPLAGPLKSNEVQRSRSLFIMLSLVIGFATLFLVFNFMKGKNNEEF